MHTYNCRTCLKHFKVAFKQAAVLHLKSAPQVQQQNAQATKCTGLRVHMVKWMCGQLTPGLDANGGKKRR
jgi:hypothetical protein